MAVFFFPLRSLLTEDKGTAAICVQMHTDMKRAAAGPPFSSVLLEGFQNYLQSPNVLIYLSFF